MMFRSGGAVLALVILLSGCKDKAEPDYAQCVHLDAWGDVKAAFDACEAAVRADPKSTSGKAATVILDKMQEKKRAEDEKRHAEEFARSPTMQRQAAFGSANDAKCHSWGTICTLGRFPDGSERTTGAQYFSTKAACDGAGADMGIKCDPCRCRN